MNDSKQELMEYFGKDCAEKILDVLQKKYPAGYSKSIEFLKDADHVQAYLQGNVTTEEEIELIRLRSCIPWFDCALAMLEGLDYAAEEYEPCVKREALDHLHHFYPKMYSVLKRFSLWLEKANNILIEEFLKVVETFHADSIGMDSIPQFASNQYQYGDVYQKLDFSFPIPGSVFENAKVTICCLVKFHYIPKNEFQNELLYGIIELTSSQKLEQQTWFTPEQKQEFFVLLSVDLVGSRQYLGKDLECNQRGEFDIPENWEFIRNAIENRKLECILKARSKAEGK